ncbi:hypothetical protein AZ78_5063 [Lysobacter capsici AZ78]|uniref:DUF5916 domain-containing protein n=1 Tax=Lysobacter capsici AZ78 TaxID=1444315 RepID=A0A108U4H6_9GAMM|nr:DUF5916 domain-containing protein [Lysobacter capsici]KWS02396.1 hypothetical protein AZ78_5063 [Lysobacter capsici AZ78]
MRTLLIFTTLMAAPIPACCAILVDGRLDPEEWREARSITDFRLTQPLSRLPAPQPTQAWVLATPQGLAVSFRNLQDASVPRTRQRTQRDNSEAAVDRVNLYVDFDGDGRGGYNFTLTLADGIVDTTVSNENQFNDDWDGDWHHAVSEDETGWSAEMLIPWHIAPMRDGRDGKRLLGIALDRVIGATGERASWPAVSLTETRFLSVLNKIEVPEYGQSLLTITPYVNGVRDFVGRDSDFDAGADLFWKPNGRFQLSATLNPDFGQVESDRLVVNFGAVETFFDDKRPFFTENQGFFEVPFGSLNPNNRLIYTRRVGGLSDDAIGSGDVAAAVKLNGSAGGVNYGVFAASEADSVGRDFYAVRASRDFLRHGVGAMVTQVKRPFLDREATVYEFDHRWTPNERWAVRSTVVGSSVDERGRRLRDSGAQVRVDYDRGNGWRHQLYALHLGGDLQLNDFGYLERNNYNYLRYDLGRRVTALPPDSPFTAHDWHYSVSHRVNDDGVHIADALAVNRRSERRDGGNQFIEVGTLSPGHDDLITRGNGVVDMPRRVFAVFERFRPRQGDSPWAFNLEMQYDADGLSGWNRGLRSVYLEPSYHINDRLSLFSGMRVEHHPDWTLWRREVGLLGTYRSNQLMLNAGAAWLINDRQELRVRLEAIGLEAQARKAWRVTPDGEPVAVNNPLADFALRNLGFQIRYRYELAPLSYLYVAYVRGGSLLEDGNGFDTRRQFRDAFELRDSEQLLVKLSYRFEI